MADRRALDLAHCRAVALARRGRAEADHARALDDVRAAEAATRAAETALDAAAEEWSGQMRRRFDPLLGALHARCLLAAADTLDAATTHAAAAAGERDECATRWRGEDARCRQTGELSARHRRRVARTTDERQLAALADRVAFDWSRP